MTSKDEKDYIELLLEIQLREMEDEMRRERIRRLVAFLTPTVLALVFGTGLILLVAR